MGDWSKIEELFHSAMAQAPERRAEFLDRACSDAPGLRKEVQELIDRATPDDGFLEGSPLSSIKKRRQRSSRAGSWEASRSGNS